MNITVPWWLWIAITRLQQAWRMPTVTFSHYRIADASRHAPTALKFEMSCGGLVYGFAYNLWAIDAAVYAVAPLVPFVRFAHWWSSRRWVVEHWMVRAGTLEHEQGTYYSWSTLTWPQRFE